jgi:pimeloyl-ACP methyl ester carboxylesterase
MTLNALSKLALLGVALAVVYQIAPGDPTWMTELYDPPKTIGDMTFQSFAFVGGDGTTTLSGRLHIPPLTNKAENDEDTVSSTVSNSLPPVIVLANGLGLTQDANSILPFVYAFTQAGFAAITFDYATFGYSDGWPRHQVKPKCHVADLKALLLHLQFNNETLPVDTSRVALWGTSMGGGHVLQVVASDHDSLPVKAIVGNVPHIKSGLESVIGTILRDPPKALTGLIKIVGALLKWTISQALINKTTYIPLHGPPGSASVMQNPGDDEGYGRLITTTTRQSGWTNLVSVGSVVPTLLYRPYSTVQKINVPTLLVVAEDDTLCPASAARDAISYIQDGRLFSIPDVGHFSVYDGQVLQVVLSESLAFFKKHV